MTDVLNARPADTASDEQTARIMSEALRAVMTLSHADQSRFSRYVLDLHEIETAVQHLISCPALLQVDPLEGERRIVLNLDARWNDTRVTNDTVMHMRQRLTARLDPPLRTGPSHEAAATSVNGTAEGTSAPTADDSAHRDGPVDRPPIAPAAQPTGNADSTGTVDSGAETARPEPVPSRSGHARRTWQDASRERLNALLTAGYDLDALVRDFNHVMQANVNISKTMVRRTARNERRTHLPDACYEHLWTIDDNVLTRKDEMKQEEQARGVAKNIQQYCETYGVSAEVLHQTIQATFSGTLEPIDNDPNAQIIKALTVRDLQSLLDGTFRMSRLNVHGKLPVGMFILIRCVTRACIAVQVTRLIELGYGPEIRDLDAPMRRLGWTGDSMEKALLDDGDNTRAVTLLPLLKAITFPPDRPVERPKIKPAQQLIIEPEKRMQFIFEYLKTHDSIRPDQLTRRFGIKGDAAVQLLKDLGLRTISNGYYRLPKS